MILGQTHLLIVLVVLATILMPGCTANSLLQDAGVAGPSILEQIPESTAINLITPDGFNLRGTYVAAQPQAPVVLHLLPSGASVETGISVGLGRTGLAPTLNALKQLGVSSVVIDYRGIGASEGRKDFDRFLEDGTAMWKKAVHLAGGREEQVIIRAGSIGTIIAAHLLENGAAPAGVIFYAPVRSSSIVHHAIASRRGDTCASLVSRFYRLPTSPDPEEVAKITQVPMLVVLPTEDDFLPDHEASVVSATYIESGHEVVDFSGDHQTTVLRSWNFALDPDSHSGRQTKTLPASELDFLYNMMPQFFEPKSVE